MANAISVTLRRNEALRIGFTQHVQLIRRIDSKNLVVIGLFDEAAWVMDVVELQIPSDSSKAVLRVPDSIGGEVDLSLGLHKSRKSAVVITVPQSRQVDVMFSRRYKELYKEGY